MSSSERISRLFGKVAGDEQAPPVEYDAWGRLVQGSPCPDDEAYGLYPSRYRDHSPTVGRWVTHDPVSYVVGDGHCHFPASSNHDGNSGE